MQKPYSFTYLKQLVFFIVLGLELSLASQRIVSFNFDFDSNLAYIPTPVVLFHKVTGEELFVSGDELAQFYHSNKMFTDLYPMHEFRENRQKPELSSFRFTDTPGHNSFLPSLKSTVESREPKAWQAYQWHRLHTVIADTELRKWVKLITSRGHPPEHVKEGFDWLHQNSYLPHTLNLDQIHTVTYRNSPTAHLRSTMAKAVVLEQHLDRISSVPSNERHYLEYSDDTTRYIETITQHLQSLKAQGKWPNVDIVITHTLSPTSEQSWLIDSKGVFKISKKIRQQLLTHIENFKSCRSQF